MAKKITYCGVEIPAPNVIGHEPRQLVCFNKSLGVFTPKDIDHSKSYDDYVFLNLRYNDETINDVCARLNQKRWHIVNGHVVPAPLNKEKAGPLFWIYFNGEIGAHATGYAQWAFGFKYGQFFETELDAIFNRDAILNAHFHPFKGGE